MSEVFWIARNKETADGFYVVSCRELRKTADGSWWSPVAVELCAKTWHKVGGKRLRPGAGPRKMRLKLVTEDV